MESFDEKDDKVERLKSEIARLERTKDYVESLLEKFNTIDHERVELVTLLNGLNNKLDELLKEDTAKSKQVPETDAEWDAWITRSERIGKILGYVVGIEGDLDSISNKMTGIKDQLERATRQSVS